MFKVGQLLVATACLITALFPPCCFAQGSVKQMYFEAKRLFENDQIQKARDMWQAIMNNHAGALSERQVRALTGRIEQANLILGTMARPQVVKKSHVEEALTALNKGALIRHKGGNAKEARALFDQAITHLEKAAEIGEQDPRYPYIMAYALLYTDRNEAALPFAEEAINASPDDTRALNLKAILLRNAKRYDEQIAVLEKSLEKDAQQENVHFEMAKALLSRGEMEDVDLAFQHSEKAIGTNKDRAFDLAKRFPYREHQERLESIGREIAIAEQRKELNMIREYQSSRKASVSSYSGGGRGAGSIQWRGSSGGSSKSSRPRKARSFLRSG